MGVAFISSEITEPEPLFPFIQVQEVCKVSIHHPFTYPACRVIKKPPIKIVVTRPPPPPVRQAPTPPVVETPKKVEPPVIKIKVEE